MPAHIWALLALLIVICAFLLFQYQAARGELARLLKKLEDERKFSHDLEKELKQKKQTTGKAKQETDDIQGKLQATKQKLAQARKECEELTAQIEELREEEPGLEEDVLHLRAHVRELEGELRQYRRNQETAEKELETRSAQLRADSNKETNRLKGLLTELDKELKSLQRRNQKLEKDLSREKKRVGSEKSYLARLEVRAENNDKAFRVTQNELKRAHRHIRELNEQLHEERRQIFEMKERVESFLGHSSQAGGKELQAELDTASRPKEIAQFESSPEVSDEALEALVGEESTGDEDFENDLESASYDDEDDEKSTDQTEKSTDQTEKSTGVQKVEEKSETSSDDSVAKSSDDSSEPTS